MKRAIFSLDAAGALREYERLSPSGSGDDIRVVVGRAELTQLLASGRVPASVVRAYSSRVWPWLLLRLLFFLGLSRTAIVCTASPHARGMKLLALALRGRVALAHLDGSQRPVSLAHFLWLAWQTFGRHAGNVCLVGATSTARLRRILDDLRARYPEASIHALTPGVARELPADSFDHLSARALLKACLRQPRFATLVIPCAGDGPGPAEGAGLLSASGLPRNLQREPGLLSGAPSGHVGPPPALAPRPVGAHSETARGARAAPVWPDSARR